MKNVIIALFVLLPSVANANVRVVASTGDLAAIARAIVGEGEVHVLAPSKQDPHYVDARPSLVVPLSRADLLVVNGLQLEVGWLPRLIESSRNPHIQPGQRGYLDASSVIDRLGVPTSKIDRSMGDIHPGGNPHFTFDPRAARRIAAAIRDRLKAIDRDRSKSYDERYRRFAAELAALDDRQHERFSHLPAKKRRVVVYHASLVYLRDWLHLERMATIEPQPGIPPSPAHVANVLKTIRATGAGVIVQESYYPKRTSQTLAKLSNAKLVILDGATSFERGQSYVEHIKEVTDALYDAMAL